MKHHFNQSLYQINTRVWLRELSNKLGYTVSLANIPDDELDLLADLGFDWVWFLGIWKTGPAGRNVSLNHSGWKKGYEESLGIFFSNDDVCGSPFAIQEYTPDPSIGDEDGLARLRSRLHSRGLKLLLDFVPNHTALDHPWAHEHPEFYIQGTEADLQRSPDNYVLTTTSAGAKVLAHGRDPNFPGWPDTLQLNYRHPALRAAMRRELRKIAARCDGVRCDLAMLILPEVSSWVWKGSSIPVNVDPADGSFWLDAIPQVRRDNPDFMFIAEVYWGYEWLLQKQGFDYTYDKSLYDKLLAKDAAGVKKHLNADPGFQSKLLRFVENHDEQRAASLFPPDIHRCVAVLTFFLPGLRFFHDGQLEGRKIKTSIHLNRRQKEGVDGELMAFYHQLLKCINRQEAKIGVWKLVTCEPAWDANQSWRQFIVFQLHLNDRRLLIAVNFAENPGQCFARLPSLNPNMVYILRDLMSSERYERQGGDLVSRGLYLDLRGWGYHAFEVSEKPV